MDLNQLPEGEHRVVVMQLDKGMKGVFVSRARSKSDSPCEDELENKHCQPQQGPCHEKPVTRGFPAIKAMPIEVSALLDGVLEELHNTIHDRELAMHDSVDIAQRTMTAVEIKGLETMLGVLTKMFKDWRKHPALMNDEIRQYLNRIHQETTNF